MARQSLKYIRYLFLILLSVSSLLFLIASISFYLSFERDNQTLRGVAEQITANENSASRKISLLNSWVYQNHGFAKNEQYYFLKKLGATPLQILQSGGDCTDKSRLLSSMLDEIGIDSSLAMQYPCVNCSPVHTVVIADIGDANTVFDPVYDMSFPLEDGKWASALDLRYDDTIMLARLKTLRMLRGSHDKIMHYDEATHHFKHLTTINWNKNGVMQTVASWLHSMGLDPQTLYRPRFLEDPKLTLSVLSGVIAVILAMSAVLIFIAGRYGQQCK